MALSVGFLCVGFLSATPLQAQAIAPSGGEFPITGALPGEQVFPALSLNGNGGLVVWQDNAIDGGAGTGIAARWLDADLNASSNVFRVNSRVVGDQLNPQVLTLSGGNTLVIWQTRDRARHSIHARVINTNAMFAGAELQISPGSSTNIVRYRTNWFAFRSNRYVRRTYGLKDVIIHLRELSGQPSAAALSDGSAVVAYQSIRRHTTNSWGLSRSIRTSGLRSITNDTLFATRQTGDTMMDVFFQRVSATGEKLGAEVQANQNSSLNQRSPAVATLSDGNFVMVWVSEQQRSLLLTANLGVDGYARVFNSQGAPLGDEFRVNTSDDLICANPSVAARAGGGFTVAWSQQEAPGSRRWDVVARSFQNTGASSGDVTYVNEHTDGDQFAPRLATVGDNQLAVWTSMGQDGSREGVYGRQLSGGVPTGSEFRINTTTLSRQLQPAIAADARGRLLSVWSSYNGDAGFDLFAQAYTLPVPVTPPSNGAFASGASFTMLVPFSITPGALGTPSATGSGSTNGGGGANAVQLALSGTAEKVALHWNTVPGAAYRVEVSADLKTWTQAGESRVATGTTDSMTLGLGQPASFYRVVQLR